jgi:NADH-quinone oxidoreductase subunit C
MNNDNETIAARISSEFGDKVSRIMSNIGELAYDVSKDSLTDVAIALRDNNLFSFEQLIDLCGVDYLTFGSEEWITNSATGSGFSRGVDRKAVILDDADQFDPKRFCVIYHLLSITNNSRIRLRVYTGTDNPPHVDSVTNIWNSANWFEREAFDLFGIIFDGHPDLRRILTDYGFIGHPFRKDFPLVGNVEVLYDEDQGKVIYQKTEIEERTLVPKVIRDDHRYQEKKQGRKND